ncbi:MAG: FAD-dependent oxidoreductase [Bacteroidota bacterium]
MIRKDFLRICGLLGVCLPVSRATALLNSSEPSSFSGKVLIVGAGAAGLSAGYLLKKKGIDFTILEAAGSFGGRMKTNHDFADFPIPLGAEWITSSTLLFNQIIKGNSSTDNINTVGYTQNDEFGVWYNNKLVRGDLGRLTYRKFVNSSWMQFFEDFIFPSVAEHIQYNAVVKSIDYSNQQVMIETQESEFMVDRVIVTVPLKILQSKAIDFKPALPEKKLEAISAATVWDGIKVFIEFEERFYPAFVDFIINPETDGQVSYYDASFGQQSERNVLGLFAVGKPAERYSAMTADALKTYILNELDQVFENQATPNYVKHIVQDWSKEPHVESAYLSDHEKPKTIQRLQKSVDDKVFFAGDCYTSGVDWGNVHNAVESAKQSVNEILG